MELVTRPRVLLADDHAVVLDALAVLLQSRYDVVARVNDGPSLVQRARELQPDVIVSDISMPGGSGLDAARALVDELHGMSFIFLTMNEDPDVAAEALRLGARGYVLKNAASVELFLAIDAALTGGTFVSPAIAGETMATLVRSQSGMLDQGKQQSRPAAPEELPGEVTGVSAPGPGAGPSVSSRDGGSENESPGVNHPGESDTGASALSALTPRQREVVDLVAQGLTMKEIGAQLHVAPRTVAFHKYRAMEVLGVTTSAELIRLATEHGRGR